MEKILNKEEIDATLLDLEKTDFADETPESIEEIVGVFKRLLREHEIGFKSDYYLKLDEFKRKAEKYFRENLIDFNQEKREYLGMSGSEKIRVISLYDYLFLSQTYEGKIRLKWRFNREGRIDTVESSVFPEKPGFEEKHSCLIIVENFEEIEPDWNNSLAFYNPLPEEINLVDEKLSKMEDLLKYRFILKKGHSKCRHLLNNLEIKNIRDFKYTGKGEQGLSKILNDATSMYLLRKACEIVAFLDLDDKGFRIRYEQFEKKYE